MTAATDAAWVDPGPTEGRVVLGSGDHEHRYEGPDDVCSICGDEGMHRYPDRVSADVVSSLVGQRKTKRMLRTKAQREADRLGADVDALTAALVALGVEEPVS